jgi:hypothetical protein
MKFFVCHGTYVLVHEGESYLTCDACQELSREEYIKDAYSWLQEALQEEHERHIYADLHLKHCVLCLLETEKKWRSRLENQLREVVTEYMRAAADLQDVLEEQRIRAERVTNRLRAVEEAVKDNPGNTTGLILEVIERPL